MKLLNRGVLNAPNGSFVNEDSSVRYLLELDPYNRYEYVDLGLPSGLKWATCNVGTSSSEQTGLYFAWGETTGYTADDVTSGVRGFTDDEYNAGSAASIDTYLTLEQNAAHVNMGGNWRMPTRDEYQELLDNCNSVWMNNYNETGIAGKVFTSKVNGKSVFFPAVGFCSYSELHNVGDTGWYRTNLCELESKDYVYANTLYFDINDEYVDYLGLYRRDGYSVRGVFK